jgi:transcriptional regulator with XRE-family HTH domain
MGKQIVRPKTPKPADILAGQRMRMRRNVIGMSQTKLGDKVGITFQQIQKYEKGTNRMGASRLQEIADVLDVPVSYFFPNDKKGKGSGIDTDLMALASTPLGLRLIKAARAITNAQVLASLVRMAETLAQTGDPH